ncbi:MAG: anhydro-N-acetylmuramic acid kinase [Pseudomonadota bacterium]
MKRRDLPDEPVHVAGAMSGTSLDGVDAAIIQTNGHTIAARGPSRYRAYSEEERATLKAALGTWHGAPEAEAASRVVEAAHGEVFADLLADDAAGPVALIGFHGQTLAHEPGGRGTHQAGDGARLARALGLPVVWDFRSADVRLGGQGAPLAPAYHFAMARQLEVQAPLAVLNLGGVGNLTWIDPTKEAPEADGAILAFDTGPANAPLNDLMQGRLGRPCDTDGALARQGQVDPAILETFASHGYFDIAPPKSLDRDAFSDLLSRVEGLADADAAATLTAAVAAAVMRGAEHFPSPVAQVLVTGGGRNNPVMMAMVAEGLAAQVMPVEDVGFDGDMLEAEAFAFLAARVVAGLPTSFPGTTGVAAAVGGGEISRPA